MTNLPGPAESHFKFVTILVSRLYNVEVTYGKILIFLDCQIWKSIQKTIFFYRHLTGLENFSSCYLDVWFLRVEFTSKRVFSSENEASHVQRHCEIVFGQFATFHPDLKQMQTATRL